MGMSVTFQDSWNYTNDSQTIFSIIIKTVTEKRKN